MDKIEKILFIGNSHTYYNFMPAMVRELFASVGENVEVTMITEGGKCLDYHAAHRNTAFNILWGNYDVVVLQGKASAFDPEKFVAGGVSIHEEFISKTNARTVLYMVWANRGKPEQQVPMIKAYRELAEKTGAVIAPAGEVWHKILKTRPAPDLYIEDGNHATPTGSYLAASTIFYAITGRQRALTVTDGEGLHSRLGIETKVAADIQRIACRTTREYAAFFEDNTKKDDNSRK
ncbi:MAG: hypothetical protein MJ102_06270 [Clostridia bacterium]|nr:hypothetical protein [Clostridia bacterium]